MRPDIEAFANRLIDGFMKDGETELLSSFADIIHDDMMPHGGGIPEDMGQQLLKWSHDYVGMYMFKRNRADEDAADQAAREFSDYVRTFIAERRKSPRDDSTSRT